jgi:diaminopimelate decarboxylase
MDHVASLVERYFGTSGNQLLVGAVPITRIVAEYNTPLFIYDCGVLKAKLTLLRQTLPPEFSISYSVKANPNPAILKYFLEQGCGLEIASSGEFLLALDAGCLAEKIVFAGPGKTEEELRLVLSRRIGEIHAESVLEVERIDKLAQELGVRAPLALRVNPAEDVQGGAMRMGGKPTQFGIDEECMESVLNFLLSHVFVEFRGVHLFTGTQILDSSVLISQYWRGLEIARRAARISRQPLQTVDFGGGLGIPIFPNDQELDMESLRSGLVVLADEIRGDALLRESHFMVEPGRFLVGDSGIYVMRVQDIKVSRGKKFLITDGGMHHHLAASGNLGQTIKRNYPIAILNKLLLPPEETVDIVGPLCTPLDVLGRNMVLPKAEVGDLIGVFQSGAYARTASPTEFLSHAQPCELLLRDGQLNLISRQEIRQSYPAELQPEKISSGRISCQTE